MDWVCGWGSGICLSPVRVKNQPTVLLVVIAQLSLLTEQLGRKVSELFQVCFYVYFGHLVCRKISHVSWFKCWSPLLPPSYPKWQHSRRRACSEEMKHFRVFLQLIFSSTFYPSQEAEPADYLSIPILSKSCVDTPAGSSWSSACTEMEGWMDGRRNWMQTCNCIF